MDYATENITAEEIEMRMEERVQAGDYQQFVALVEAADWAAQRPEALTTAIDLALHLDMTRLAVKLAEMGGRLFPDHERVQQAARVLAAPAQTRLVHQPCAKGLAASRAWLYEHASQYQGQWVAVREGKLLGAASSLEALIPVIGQGEDSVSTIVTRIS